MCLRSPKQNSCGRVFSNPQELNLELFDYVNGFNNVRIHEALCYLTLASVITSLQLNNILRQKPPNSRICFKLFSKY
ncbi:IS3 family transposase [Anoxybacillus sp. PDR2]|nr:IS3 family transposase [Anoxybacillus sp. PDR2]